MRLHRFYTNEKVGNKSGLIIASPEISNQIRAVFRLKIGDRVIFFDGSGNDYECIIESFKDKEEISLKVVEVRPSQYMPTRKIYLYQSVIKKDKFEWVVEKATELGITDIVPIITERSEKKSLNLERLKKIAVEASEQCGRGDIPLITCPRPDLGQVINSNSSQKLVFSCGDTVERLSPNHNTDSDISVFIGPEGGWTEREIELFHNAKVPIFSLGKQTFRAETATIVALARLV